MGQIVAAYDLMPSGTDTDLDMVIKTIAGVVPAGVRVLETKIMPVAFGLMKVNVGFVIDDTDDSIGGNLEKALFGIDGIENVECVSNTVL